MNNKYQDQFDEAIDEITEPFTLGDLSYPASLILKKVDPIAYHQEYLNYLDAEGLDEDDIDENEDEADE